MSKFATVLAAALLAGAPAAAQTPPSGQTFAFAQTLLRGYQYNQKSLLAAAEKMPESEYAFRPTKDVRPFGELIAHVALSQFGSCATLKQEPNPKKDVKEDVVRSKAALVALLKASTEYCDPAVNALTDAALTELVPARNDNKVAKGIFLAGLNTHGNEMYGYMAVYLRLKGIVPPTSEKQTN